MEERVRRESVREIEMEGERERRERDRCIVSCPGTSRYHFRYYIYIQPLYAHIPKIGISLLVPFGVTMSYTKPLNGHLYQIE